MALFHFVCKMHAKISPLKLVPVVCSFNYIPISHKSNFNYSCNQNSTKRRVPGFLIPMRMFWETFPDTRRYTLFEKDGVDREHFELIYRTKMFGYVFYTQLVCETVLAIEMVCGIMMVIRSLMGEKIPFLEIYSTPLIFDSIGFGVLAFFTLQTAIFYQCSHRSVLRIYYSEEDEEYIAVFLKANPFVTQQLRCKPGDLIEYPQTPLSSAFGNHRLKGKRAIVNLGYFKDLFHYNHLLGSLQHRPL